ncbi:polysaccharide deacetylase family protein [Streptomyces polygonati]|uniref:Polysaccharide deacetylase family protein n=1 Tax=Streptomyces polygonati TaxID=1617087 RepID=A0ABV8HKE2_9ACTN
MAARRLSLARLRSAPQVAAIGLALLVVLIAVLLSALLTPGSGGGGSPPADDGKALSAANPAPGTTESPAPSTTPSPGGRISPAPPAVPDTIQHLPESTGKYVAITIDDGPDAVWTPKILQVLRRHHAHATFCMIGPQARANPALVKEVVAQGHRLCDHTVHHDTAMDKKSVAYQTAEILGAQDMIRRAAGGARVYYYRAPGGAFTPASRALAARHGMRPLGWNIDTKDFDRPGVAVILHTLKDEIHNGPTILFHDGGGNRGQTVKALDQALTWLRQQGYGFSFPKVD